MSVLIMLIATFLVQLLRPRLCAILKPCSSKRLKLAYAPIEDSDQPLCFPQTIYVCNLSSLVSISNFTCFVAGIILHDLQKS